MKASTFTFVSVEGGRNPRGDGIAPADRHRIRSNAATNPWNRGVAKVTTKVAAGRKKRKATSNIELLSYSDLQAATANADATSSRRKGSDEASSVRPSDGSADEHTSADSPDVEDDLGREDLALRRLNNQFFVKHDASGASMNDSSSVLEFVPASLDCTRIDPFWQFSIPYDPILPTLIYYRLVHFSPKILELDKDSLEPLTRAFFNHGKETPAFAYASLLISAAQLVNSGNQNVVSGSSPGPAIICKEHVYWMRGCAITAINAGLSDRTLAITDGMIGAVMCLSCYEYFFGDKAWYKAHLLGWKRMLALRGGIQQLHPTMSRVLIWMTTLIEELGSVLPNTGLVGEERSLEGFAADAMGHVEFEDEEEHESAINLDAIVNIDT